MRDRAICPRCGKKALTYVTEVEGNVTRYYVYKVMCLSCHKTNSKFFPYKEDAEEDFFCEKKDSV